MKWTKFISICFLFILFMIPTTAYAVDFDISDVQIDVYLKEDGNAEVVEQHTYRFDSKFKGITREIVPKQGSSIIDFKAFENGKALKVEKEQNTYKVYRSGKKETVPFDMHYTIVQAIEKYEDGAQFYWPFFDKRNEADYGNMNITVHPPAKAEKVDYLGYDAAYKKGSIGSEGTVKFSLGEVPKKTNGDIRVIYEPTLFPLVGGYDGTIRNQLHADQDRLAEELAQFLATQKDMKTVGLYTVTGFALFVFGLFTHMFVKRRGTKQAAQSLVEEDFIPKQKLSMPATIYYTNPSEIGPEVISAALLDLIRKGYVKQITEESFELINREKANKHESALIDLLFKKVGDGARFNLDDLKSFTDDEKNHETYGSGLDQWRSAIMQEVKGADLYEQNVRLRWIIGLLSIALIPVIIQLGRYEVYPFMAVLIILGLIGLSVALFYYTRNLFGFQIKEEWKQFRKRFESLNMSDWEQLPVDDKYRAYIYGIGVKDGNLEKMYHEFERAERRSESADHPYYVPYNPVFMTQSFTTANANAAVSTGGSSTSISSGGGVGGGGGGSGAF